MIIRALSNIVLKWNKSKKLEKAIQNLHRFALIESKSWNKLTKLVAVSKRLNKFANRVNSTFKYLISVQENSV